MRFNPSRKTLLIVGATAVVLLGAGGLNVSQQQPTEMTSKSTASAQADEASPQEGEVLEGVIALSAEQIEAAGISIVSVSRGGGGETRLSGRVEAMTDARASVGAMVGGTVERVLVAPGQQVRAGQALVQLVSGEGAALRADIDAASAAASAASLAFQRNRSLAEQGVVARQEVEASQAEAASAAATARAARARAAAAGSPSASGRMSISAQLPVLVPAPVPPANGISFAAVTTSSLVRFRPMSETVQRSSGAETETDMSSLV